MTKENQPIMLDVNPRIKQLQTSITASNAFNKDSIKEDAITNLFTSLLNQPSISLTAPSFANPNDNSLQVTADASLFSKSIKITAVFAVDAEDNLSMTMNTNGETSMLLSTIYEVGLVPSDKTAGYIPAVPVDGLSFVFDSAASAFTLKGEGDNWTFLGYTNLYVKKPTLTLTSVYDNGLIDYTWKVAGTLTSDTATVNIPLQVQLPIGITGWSISAGPLTLDNGLGIIDALTGISVSGMLPQGFTDLLANIEITNFYAAFDPKEKTLSTVQLQVHTKAPWEIVPGKLKLNEGITLLLNAQRFDMQQPFSFSGSISGSASVNYANPNDEVKAAAKIPIPLTGSDWSITLANDKSPLGFGKLLALAPGVKDFLPDTLYDKLNEIVLDFLTIKFKFDNGFSFTKVAFAIHSAKEWQLPYLQEAIYFDKDFRFALDIQLPYKSETTTGSLGGVIQIDSGNISIPVELSKTPEDTNWNLQVTADEIPLPSISSLSSFMGGNVLDTASPSGLMKIGNFAIYNLELIWQFGAQSKLQRFAFTISSTPDSPAWNLVPGYFELTELFVSIAIDNNSVSDKNISGSIGTTVTWVLNKEKQSKLVLFMLASKPSSADPWKFAGSLKEDLILKDLLIALKTPQPVVDILPDLKLTQFDLSIEPTSGSFSIAMAIATTDTWTILTIGTMNVNMQNMGFSVEKYAGYLEMSASGVFELVANKKTSTVTLTANYKNKDWSFTGTYDNSGANGITINEVLAEYIPGIDSGTVPQLKIVKVLVAIVKGNTEANVAYNTLHFVFAGELSIMDKLLIKANIDLLYDSRVVASPYNGTKLQGVVEFGGLSFTALAKYNNGKFSEYEFLLTFKNIVAKASVVDNADSTTFRFSLQSTDPNKPLTLGNVISTIVEAATGEPVNVPSPWDFILNISINNFGFIFILDKKTNTKTVGVTYEPKINLGFINIEELSILYSPGADDKNGPIEFRVTKGTFLGMPIDQLPQQQRPDWDLRDPSKAPAVPGFGNSKFKLEFLGLGNQVAIKTKTPPASVTQAITNLAEAFTTGSTAKLPPELYFDKNYGVLIGAQFILIEYINIAVVFYDPVMYGLSVSVKGGKFENLSFEILYKKVNDNVGMFQINLTLPDFVRQQQFGAVSVTLPSISLSIYTNGDFVIDMGFPKNGDFSRSFGLEFSIFTGAGGFYFGKLSNDTATNMPKGKGQFNPVIIFGIGIRAGLGRSIDKGPLKAEFSLTIQVILEGVLAWYKANPNSPVPQSSDEVLYFKLQAQAALVGRIYGEIDFVIISASLDIMVRIMLQLTVESYRQSLVTFSAEVYASVKLRINLGLFKITISCSFRTGFTDTFTIGSNDPAPWDTAFLVNRSAYFTPLDAPMNINIPKMLWSAPLDYPKNELDLLFIPQVSVKYDDAAATKKQAVAASLLFVNNIPDAATDTNFTALCRAFLAWVFNAYFSGKDMKEAKILDQPVTIDDVNAIFQYFDQKKISTGKEDAFGVKDLYDYFFAQAFTSVAITTKEAGQQGSANDTVEEVAFFPVFPMFEMIVNTDTPIKFSEFNKCDTAYLDRIRTYFAEMQVQYKEAQQANMLRDGEQLTMAEFMFTDYFVMMAKTGLQDVVNGFKQTAIETQQYDTLDNIVARYKHYGVTAQGLAFANRHQILKEATSLHIPAFKYRLRDNERLDTFLGQFPLNENAVVSADGTIAMPSFVYSIPAEHASATLWTMASRFGVDFEALVEYNKDRPIFKEGTRLLHDFVETKTVKEILDELQNGAQHNMANIAGTVSRFFLHGLRIPKAVTGDDRVGLYEATGQQFNLTGTITGQQVSLGVPVADTPEWLKLGTGTGLQFKFDQAMSDAVSELVTSNWVPGVTLDKQEDVKRYRLQPRTFALATSFSWKDPNPHALKSTLVETFIWTFPSQLQQYLDSYNTIPYQLLVQSANTAFSQTEPTVVTPMFWGTFVTVNLRRVPIAAMPGNYVDNVYVVDGCGEADGQLLQHMLLSGNHPIANLDILFADNSARPNEGKEVKGLVSNGLTQYSTFLLQTNYSTISNPNAFNEDVAETAGSNLLGMDALTFLTYLWECSIVRSGGYYLHYKNATGGGLPEYIFNEEGEGAVRILVSYNIPVQPESGGYLLPAYVNTAVIDVKIDAKQDTLLAGIALTTAQQEQFDPVLQNIQTTILPGTGMFKGSRANPQTLLAASLTESAEQQLSELFQLMEYRIQTTPGVFKQSNFALPAGPLDTNEGLQNCMSRLPVAMQTTLWNYGAVLPVYPFVDVAGETELQKDPYAANGKTATVYFNFLDVFGNTLVQDGGNQITQQITPGYTDTLIGIDQWINVTQRYNITQDAVSLKPVLTIKLVFDMLRYKEAKDPKAMAQQDLKLYSQVSNQLAQQGVTASVQSSIGVLEQPATAPLQVLQNYITEVVTFLSQVTTNVQDNTPITATFTYGIDAAQLNAEYIFQLSVSITIERTLYIDPQFDKEASVKSATAVIPPDLYTGSTKEKTALSIFAADLEKALPVMKVAVGASSNTKGASNVGSVDTGTDKEIWLARFATGTEKGISFTVTPSPVYFGIKPLSTTLISRPDEKHTRAVPLRPYTTGQYIGNATAEQKAFAGIDMELMAQRFISLVDTFLSAENSTQAWKIQQSGKTDYFPQPFQQVEQAKRTIAKAVADSQLTNILQQGDFTKLAAAQAAMEQQMLVLLGNMYKIDAVVQAAANVSQGFDKPSANLYGQVVFADNNIPDNTYYFTPVKISLTKGQQTFNTFFSVQQEAGHSGTDAGVDLIDRFKAGLNFQITGLEHNFGTPVNGYVPSSWLTFANPVLQTGAADKPLVDADIPVPLKAYPTAPSLVAQQGIASQQAGETGKTPEENLKEALLWDYSFAYNYVIARQDLIYLDIELNVQHSQLVTADEAPLDLFEALMQFHGAQSAVLTDIAKADENSLVALQSFAWLVKQVADAWPSWFASIDANKLGLTKKSLRYIIKEEPEDGTGKLLISIQPEKAGLTSIVPFITIDGLETKDYSFVGEKQVYYFVQVTDTSEAPLLFSERKKFSERGLVIKRNNVLIDENAWAGVAIHRNEVLAGQPANEAFRYITPYIRFADACYPSLNNQTAINIADFTAGAAPNKKAKLQTLLLNFFNELLKSDKERQVMLQMQGNYSYALQPDPATPLQLGPVLPIVMLPPVSVTGNTIATILQPLSTAILNWFKDHEVIGRDTTGSVQLIISLFAATSGAMHHPVLTLEGPYLPTNVVDFG